MSFQTTRRPCGHISGGGNSSRDGETGANVQADQLPRHRQTPTDTGVGAGEPTPQQIRRRS